jgi:hypothetical protein
VLGIGTQMYTFFFPTCVYSPPCFNWYYTGVDVLMPYSIFHLHVCDSLACVMSTTAILLAGPYLHDIQDHLDHESRWRWSLEFSTLNRNTSSSFDYHVTPQEQLQRSEIAYAALMYTITNSFQKILLIVDCWTSTL